MADSGQILIVDDDKTLANILRLTLIEEGYRVTAVYSAVQASEQIDNQSFDVIILDLVLPDTEGVDLLRKLIKRFPGTCFIIFTGYASIASAIEALKAGAYDYILKPFDVEHLKLVIKRGIKNQRLINKNKELFERIEKEKRKLEIILSAYNKISNVLKLAELADFITAYAVEIAEAEKASLMMIDESANELVLQAVKGLDREKVAWRMKVGDLIAGWVAKEGKALLVTDIDTDPRLRAYAKSRRYKTKSFISLPLKSDSRIIGVMNVTDKLAATNIFTEDDLRYLSLLAHQAVAQIENIRLCEKLSSLAVTDALTNLFNHRYFHEQLNREIMRAERYKHPLSLIMFDIDGFKAYNDTFGHLEGDKILKQVASIMRDNIRHVDIICRYGGEEFTVILPDTNVEGAKVIAEKIRKVIEKSTISYKETKEVMGLTVSGGVSGYKEGLNKEELIARADQALYKAKDLGKNKTCVF